MKSIMWCSPSRTSVVCIDEYENGILNGRIYNSQLDAGIRFRSTMEFLKKMDSILEQMKCPQSFSVNRVFQPIQEADEVGPPSVAHKDGKLATFTLQILFRQNASWQGAVTWMEGNQEESFRSALELLFLIDSALRANE